MNSEPDKAAGMTVLDGQNRCVPIRILSFSERSMVVACSADIHPGTAVKITWGNLIVLAEVLSGETSDGQRALHVRHCMNTDDLAVIARLWA